MTGRKLCSYLLTDASCTDCITNIRASPRSALMGGRMPNHRRKGHCRHRRTRITRTTAWKRDYSTVHSYLTYLIGMFCLWLHQQLSTIKSNLRSTTYITTLPCFQTGGPHLMCVTSSVQKKQKP